MRPSIWTALALISHVQAQSIVTVCESYSFTATSTFTEYETFYVDAQGNVRTIPSTPLYTSSTVTTSIGDPTTSNGISNGGIANSRTTSSSMSGNVPGNGTAVVIPDNTIAPSMPISTSMTAPSNPSSSTRSTTTSSSSATTEQTTTSSTGTSTSTSTTASASTISTPTVSTTTVTITSSTISTLTSTSISTSTAPTLGSNPFSTSTSTTLTVTNKAYIDTILRHHNQHRFNHTSNPLTWNSTLAETAKKIANSCVYQHDTATDCPPGGPSCYGQNIAAGYLSTQMSFLVSDGFYNSEVNSYTYYGGEPADGTLQNWGHFSQIVWKIDTFSVGCYSMDCEGRSGGLVFPGGGGQGIRPVFTVCNYGGPGNYIGEFKQNVIKPKRLPSIHAGYMCPNLDNCEDGATV